MGQQAAHKLCCTHTLTIYYLLPGIDYCIDYCTTSGHEKKAKVARNYYGVDYVYNAVLVQYKGQGLWIDLTVDGKMRSSSCQGLKTLLLDFVDFVIVIATSRHEFGSQVAQYSTLHYSTLLGSLTTM